MCAGMWHACMHLCTRVRDKHGEKGMTWHGLMLVENDMFRPLLMASLYLLSHVAWLFACCTPSRLLLRFLMNKRLQHADRKRQADRNILNSSSNLNAYPSYLPLPLPCPSLLTLMPISVLCASHPPHTPLCAHDITAHTCLLYILCMPSLSLSPLNLSIHTMAKHTWAL